MRSFLTRRWRLFSGVLALYLLVAPAFAEGTYTVKSGDTLFKVAKKLSISLSELLASNHIAHPDKLIAGQVLTVPGKDEKASDDGKAKSQTAEKTQPKGKPSLNPHQLAAERAKLLAGDKGKQLAATAQEYLGVRYVWAGSSPSRGMDCSGLVMRSMAVLGKNVPHNAAALYKMGQRVRYAELQPGDLVFFNTRGNSVSHVGIWLGDNTFIHASTRNGVTRQKMQGYYAKRLVGARRVN